MTRRNLQFFNVPLLCALSLSSAACVTQATYEEARSASEVEREAARRAKVALSELRKQTAELRQQLDQRESFVQEQEQKLAESDLDLKVAHRERDATGDLVTQLRGELARVGGHLRVYSEEKQRLADELQAAEGRARVLDRQQAHLREFTRLVQNISLLEAGAIRTGAFELTTVSLNPALEVRQQTLAPGGHLGTEGKHLMKTLARLSVLHPRLKVAVSQKLSDASADQPSPDVVLLRKIVGELAAEGIDSSRVILDVAEAGQTAASPDPDAEGDASIVFVLQANATNESPTEDSASPEM
jgi:hypothetical protein